MTDHLDEKFVHPVESQRCVSSNHGVAIFSIRPFLHFFVRCQFHALRLTHFHSDKIQHKRKNKWCKLRFSKASCCLMYDCDVQHRPFEWYVRCRLDKLIDYIRCMVMNCHCFVEAILHAIQCKKMTSKSEGPYHWRGEWNIDGSWDERKSLKSHRLFMKMKPNSIELFIFSPHLNQRLKYLSTYYPHTGEMCGV